MANFIRGFFEEGARWAGAITAICALIYGGWLLGSPLAASFVSSVVESHKLETIEHVDAVRRDLLAARDDISEIVEDRKELSKKREQQFEEVKKQIGDLSLKVEGTNQRILTQIEGLTALVSRLNTQLDSLNGRLRLRLGSGATQDQDRITAEEAPQ